MTKVAHWSVSPKKGPCCLAILPDDESRALVGVAEKGTLLPCDTVLLASLGPFICEHLEGYLLLLFEVRELVCVDCRYTHHFSSEVTEGFEFVLEVLEEDELA